MRIFVINLASATERREHMRAQLAETDLDYEFLPAVTPDEAPEYFKGINHFMCLMTMGRLSVPAELGCFASHKVIWQRAVEADEPVVVLEDDVQLTEKFVPALEYLGKHVGHYGFVRLEGMYDARLWGYQSDPVEVARFDDSIIYYQMVPIMQTAAYAVSPAAAAKLLASADAFEGAVDHYLRRVWRHGQPLFALYPEPAPLSSLEEDSTIGHRTYAPGRLLRLARQPYKATARRALRRFNEATLARYLGRHG